MSEGIYYAKVDKRDIAFIRFIFEGYENIGFVRTLDSVRGYIEFIISPDLDGDFHFVLDALRESLPLELMDKPEGYESIGDTVF